VNGRLPKVTLNVNDRTHCEYETEASEVMAQETVALARELLKHLEIHLTQEQEETGEQEDRP